MTGRFDWRNTHYSSPAKGDITKLKAMPTLADLEDELEWYADAIEDGAAGWERESYDARGLRLVAARARHLAQLVRERGGSGTP